ncbi:MAG: hypothetical protein ACLPSW_12900 [Roseiarcus sp.]
MHNQTPRSGPTSDEQAGRFAFLFLPIIGYRGADFVVQELLGALHYRKQVAIDVFFDGHTAAGIT